ncbi:MAG: septum formation initiator family protein [bacterium]|nr:septum formation initiator family protein [bacterium]
MRRTNAPRDRTLLRSRAALLIGIVVVGFVLSAIVSEYRRKRAVEEEIRMIADTVSALEQQRVRLTDLLEQSETPEFIEREARLRLGLQQPGEDVLIVPSGTVFDAPDAAAPPAAEEGSNFTRWWHHLFH